MVNIYSEVIEAGSDIRSKNYTVPITLLGTSSVLPLHILATGQYAAVQFPGNIFAPSSPNYAGLPAWSQMDNGISSPAGAPYQIACSIVDATDAVPALSLYGTPNPLFWQGSGPIAPRLCNVGIVSPYRMPMSVAVLKDPSATWLNAVLDTGTTPATLFLSVNSTATPNKYSTTLQLTSPQEPGASFPILVTFNDEPSPWFTRYGFTHSASYVSQVVAPGMPFLIGGGEFGPSTHCGVHSGSEQLRVDCGRQHAGAVRRAGGPAGLFGEYRGDRIRGGPGAVRTEREGPDECPGHL